MRSFGIDIGQQTVEIGEWTQDCYGLSSDGVAKLFSNDSSKDSSRNVILFNNREVTACDHVGSRIASAPDSCVTGCFNLFYPATEQSLRFENLFSPCELTNEDGMVHCVLACGGEPKESISCVVPASFLFEYMFYLSMKKSNDLYYSRRERSVDAVNSDALFTVAIPDSFSPREISILSSVLDGMHCRNYAFVRTWIAIALEYGYYNGKAGRYDATPRRILFFDSGASHTTLFVVLFSKNSIHLESLKCIEGVSGRQIDAALLQYILQDHPASFKEHSKKHIRFMEAIEKTKRELCLEGVTEVMMDVSDFFDDEDDIEVSLDQFEEACRPTTTLFTQQVDAFLTELHPHSLAIDAILPVGGNTRVPFLMQALVDRVALFMKQTIKVEHTVNVDDCVTLGTILASHLLEKRGIVAEEGKENTLFPHWSSFDSDDTQSKLRVSSEVSEVRSLNPIALSKQEKSIIQTTINHVLRAEKAMHEVHARCTASERMLQTLKKTEIDLSFFDPKLTEVASACGKRWKYVPRWAFPSEEFEVLCWLQQHGKNFAMPVWKDSDEWIVKNMTAGVEGEKNQMALDLIKTNQLAKRMVLKSPLSGVYPKIQKVARMLAQLKRLSEKQSTIVTDMEKLIYNTPRAKLDPKELAEKSTLVEECLQVVESSATIRDMLNELTQCL